MNKNFATYLAYALSTIAVIAVARLFNVGSEFVSLYWPIAFFAVAGLDFYKSQIVEGGASEVRAYACAPRTQPGVYLDRWGYVRVDYFGSPRQYPAANQADGSATLDPICSQPRSLGDNYTDRFLGYVLTAPFILPVKLYQAFTR
ncbi:MAG: hypothetical protein IT342_17085 [Candidatus Melainabacteria bacterium]|nr:hypothetical protein [Candidatus Melainabacteria bacterium]